jgi:hypothetical protein
VNEVNSGFGRAFFDHIPKTGGTACYEYFLHSMGTELVSPFVLFELAGDALAKHSRRALVSGHFEPLPGCLPEDRFSFTLLRDPIERILSEYSALLFDEMAQPGHAFEAIRKVKNTPLIELLYEEDPRISIVFRNRQTRHFASYIAVIDDKTSEEAMLNYAKEALAQFDLVGVYDDLEGFIDLVCERLRLPIPDTLPAQNVTSKKVPFASLSGREQELLVKLNRADIDLVKYATTSYRRARRDTLRRISDSRANPGVPTAELESPNLSRTFQRLASARPANFGTLEVEIIEVTIKGTISNGREVFSGENTTIQVLFRANVDEDDLTVGLRITDSSGALIYGTNTYHQGIKLKIAGGTHCFVDFAFRMILGLGKYRVGVTIHTGAAHTGRCFHWKDDVARFAVVGNIEEHFEGVSNLCMSILGGTINSGNFALSRREMDTLNFRSLVLHSPAIAEPSAIVMLPQGESVKVQPEEVFSVAITVKNDGREVWPPGGTRPVCCAYHIFDTDGKCITYDGIRTRLREAVRPDETVNLNIAVAAPKEAGTYEVEMDLVQETVRWFEASGIKRITLQVAR